MPSPQPQSPDRARDMTRRQAYGVQILEGMLSRIPPPNPGEMEVWARTAWRWADVLIATENLP